MSRHRGLPATGLLFFVLMLASCARQETVEEPNAAAPPAAGTATADLRVAPEMEIEEPPPAVSPGAKTTALEARPETPARLAQEVAEVAPAIGPEGAHRITLANVRELMSRGEVVLADTRGSAQFVESHAEGAIHLPLDRVQERLGDLPKDKWIVTYCT